MIYKEGGMKPGQIEVPHIPAMKSTGSVAFKYGVGRLIGHDVITVLNQFTKLIVDRLQTLCGSHHPVTYGGRTQMDAFTLKNVQLSVQRQVIVIFGGGNVGQYTLRGIAVRVCHYGHGSSYDTTVGKPVFRTDDASHIESGRADGILFAHFLPQLRRSLQRKTFRHGNDDFFTGKGRIDGLTGVGSNLLGEALTETIVTILRPGRFLSRFLLLRYRVIDIGRRFKTDAQLVGIFGKMTFFTGFTP